MLNLTEILQCPVTGRDLDWASEDRLSVKDGPSYLYRDGIACLLPQSEDGVSLNDDGKEILDFYESAGWTEDTQGQFGDTKAFTDGRAVSVDFSDRCMARLGKYFRKGGQYLLDAGSGPIPHDELLRFGDRFQQRVCLDLSVQGLQTAKRKLGDRGVYVQGDLTNLPLKTGSMDAVTCNHVLYQIPAELQLKALLELWRVLKPGGIAVVVYFWPTSPLDWRLQQIAKRIFGMRVAQPDQADSAAQSHVELPHNTLPESWFQSQKLPFQYTVDTFRVVSQSFLKSNVSNDWRGRAFVNFLFAFQVLAPGFCGKHGALPAIVIRKPTASTA